VCNCGGEGCIGLHELIEHCAFSSGGRSEVVKVAIKVLNEFFGGDVGVEGALVAEVTVPQFIDCILDELSHGMLSGFEGRIIVDKDSMFSFGAGADDWSGVVGNDGVGRGPGGDWERHAPSGGVRCHRFNDTDEVVRARVIVRDLKEERVEDFSKCSEVVVGGLANNGLE
jgi:hypothetical protein